VLVPHGRHDAKLGQRRLAADQLLEALVLVGLEAVLRDQFGGDLDIVLEGGLGSHLREGSDSVGGGHKSGCPSNVRTRGDTYNSPGFGQSVVDVEIEGVAAIVGIESARTDTPLIMALPCLNTVAQ
jgi:hypothetical protein